MNKAIPAEQAGWLNYNKHNYPTDHEYDYNTFQFSAIQEPVTNM